MLSFYKSSRSIVDQVIPLQLLVTNFSQLINKNDDFRESINGRGLVMLFNSGLFTYYLYVPCFFLVAIYLLTVKPDNSLYKFTIYETRCITLLIFLNCITKLIQNICYLIMNVQILHLYFTSLCYLILCSLVVISVTWWRCKRPILVIVAFSLCLFSLCDIAYFTISINFTHRTTFFSLSILQFILMYSSSLYILLTANVLSMIYKYYSLITFSWMNVLITRALNRNLLSSTDFLDLPRYLHAKLCCINLYLLNKTQSEGEFSDSIVFRFVSSNLSEYLFSARGNVSLLLLLARLYWKRFVLLGLLKIFADTLIFVGPVILSYVIQYIESPIRNHSWHGYIYAASISTATLISSVCITQYDFHIAMLRIRISSFLIGILHYKCLSTSLAERGIFSDGEVVTLMSVDVDRSINFCNSFHAFLSLPIQLVLSLYLLYLQVKLSFLAALIFTILLLPVNKYIASKIAYFSARMLEYKDKRVSFLSFLLSNILALKLNSWEKLMAYRIGSIRDNEVKYLAKQKYLDAWCVFFWALTPTIMCTLTFVIYTSMGNTLSASTVFTTIALLNILKNPVNAFAWSLNGLVDALVSIRRIQRVIRLTDKIEFSQIIDSGSHVTLHEADFGWNKDRVLLNRINLSIEDGTFVRIGGDHSSGKTSLILAILGEMHWLRGSIAINRSICHSLGYVSQTPWIMSASLRQNILLGSTFHPERYNDVLRICDLTHDIERIPQGDLVQLQSGGTNISGGQRVRVALARALYHRCRLYLIDAPTVSLDKTVASHIMRSLHSLITEDHSLAILITGDCSTVSAPQFCNTLIVSMKRNEDDTYGMVMDNSDGTQLSANTLDKLEDAAASVDSYSDASLSEPEIIYNPNTGSIDRAIWMLYIKSVGISLTALILISLVSMQAGRTLTDLWLTYYITGYFRSTRFTTTYSIFACANALLTLLRSFLFAYGSIVAARHIHVHLVDSVLRKRMSFFSENSVGKILNRLSSDVNAVDGSLPFIMNILLAQCCGLVALLFVTVYALPPILIVYLPLVLLFWRVLHCYRCSSRVLKRLTSLSMSPLYSLFAETLKGAVQIRAFACQYDVTCSLFAALDVYQQAQFCLFSLAAWLNFRLQMMASILICSIVLVAVLVPAVNSVFIGLALSYALSMTGCLNGVITSFTETEKEMISVERIAEFLTTEQLRILTTRDVQAVRGDLTFSDVCLSYASCPSSLQLDHVSFSISAGESLGVIGRTGSGKSTLISALMAAFPLLSGRISIDGIDLRHFDRETLSRNVCVLSQRPLLLPGSLRDNIDPLDTADDACIMRALHLCELHHLSSGLDLDLNADHLSQAEKQLICLARCVLSRARVVCLDEVTAGIEGHTCERLTRTIVECLAGRTVISVGHTVSAVEWCQSVLVLVDGAVRESGSPQHLASTRDSLYNALLK